MSSLIEVKSKIAATRNTRKITKAMQLVATSRMKQLQKTAISVRSFASELINLWTNELHSIEVPRWNQTRKSGSSSEVERPPTPSVILEPAAKRTDIWDPETKTNKNEPSVHRSPLTVHPDAKRLFVLYSSDKGLCGGMNQQLIKALINSSVWLETPEQNRIVVVFGRKGTDYLRFRKIAVDQSFVNLPDTLTPADAYGYIDAILKYWDTPSPVIASPTKQSPEPNHSPFTVNRSPVSAVYMVAPHYKNSFTFYPIVKQFLPITRESLRQHLGPTHLLNIQGEPGEALAKPGQTSTDPASGVIPSVPEGSPEPTSQTVHSSPLTVHSQLTYFEPSKLEIAESVLENLANALFLQAFYELKATEYSSRMIAMQNATSAAEKMIDEKTLLLNSIRQQRITQEIAEITGSAMVIN